MLAATVRATAGIRDAFRTTTGNAILEFAAERLTLPVVFTMSGLGAATLGCSERKQERQHREYRDPSYHWLPHAKPTGAYSNHSFDSFDVQRFPGSPVAEVRLI